MSMSTMLARTAEETAFLEGYRPDQGPDAVIVHIQSVLSRLIHSWAYRYQIKDHPLASSEDVEAALTLKLCELVPDLMATHKDDHPLEIFRVICTSLKNRAVDIKRSVVATYRSTELNSILDIDSDTLPPEVWSALASPEYYSDFSLPDFIDLLLSDLAREVVLAVVVYDDSVIQEALIAEQTERQTRFKDPSYSRIPIGLLAKRFGVARTTMSAAISEIQNVYDLYISGTLKGNIMAVMTQSPYYDMSVKDLQNLVGQRRIKDVDITNRVGMIHALMEYDDQTILDDLLEDIESEEETDTQPDIEDVLDDVRIEVSGSDSPPVVPEGRHVVEGDGFVRTVGHLGLLLPIGWQLVLLREGANEWRAGMVKPEDSVPLVAMPVSVPVDQTPRTVVSAMRKLSAEQIREIRELHADTEVSPRWSVRKLAERFDVKRSTMQDILSGKTYKDVP